MIVHVKVQYADGSETILGSEAVIEENKPNEIIEKLEVTCDQHFAIEISPSSKQSESLSPVRFRVGGSYSEPQIFKRLSEKLVTESPDSV